MTITLRQKDLANGNKSLYLDIYENGKRKFEYLSLYLLPEIDEKTMSANAETIEQAQQIRAERILHPETIPGKGHLAVVHEVADDDSPEVMDWIQSYIDWMDGNPEYSKAAVVQTLYLQERMREFLNSKRRPHITLRKFDKTWFKAFFLWMKNDYVPHKYVRMETKPLSHSTLRNVQQRIVAVFNKAVKTGKLNANPFYQLEKCDTFAKVKATDRKSLTPDELKAFMSSAETSPGVAETQKAFGFACLTGLRISDIMNLRWPDIVRSKDTSTLVIVQKKTKSLNAVPICSTAMQWLPEKGADDKVFHLPAKANVDAALKRIAKRAGIEKNISFHTSRHTFGTLIQAATGDIETTKKLMGHKSLKSTAVYADVLTEEKVKAVCNAQSAFKDCKRGAENRTIPKTKRTAATNTHPRKVIDKGEESPDHEVRLLLSG